MNTIIYNVREYGAEGDGTTKDTASVQRAVDACAKDGGGTVYVPAGIYLCGTIYLKNNVEFHLSAGATILGSPDREDYNSDDVFPENEVFSRENVTAAHLIIAYRQENVSIIGSGTINGNSPVFFEPFPEGAIATYRWKNRNFPISSWRPGQMIFFCRCTRVAVRDIRLIDSPYWGLFLLGCENVKIHGLTIENPAASQNGDGIDIDCSRNVTISNCTIRSGDDCITVRGNKKRLGENAMPSENITVTNCILSTPCNAIRIGVGDGEIRNCTFNNIVVTETRTAINIVSSYSHRSKHGVRIEQVHFSDFIIDAVSPIKVYTGVHAANPAAIRDISFNRFTVKAWAGSFIFGTSDVPIERISMNDINWYISGGTQNCDFHSEIPADKGNYDGMNGEPSLPCVLYGKHLHGLSLNNIRVYWDQISLVWRDGFFIECSTEVDFQQVKLRQPQDDGGAALHCRECHDVSLQGCRAEFGTHTFLQLEKSHARWQNKGNDLSDAIQPVLNMEI